MIFVQLAADTRVLEKQERCIVIAVRKKDFKGHWKTARVSIPTPQLRRRDGRLLIPAWLASDYDLPSEPYGDIGP